jgi:hypothetical protein
MGRSSSSTRNQATSASPWAAEPGPIWLCAAWRRAAAPRVVYAGSMSGSEGWPAGTRAAPKDGERGCGPVTVPGRESGRCRARRRAQQVTTAAAAWSADGSHSFVPPVGSEDPGHAVPPFETCRLGRRTSTPGQTCWGGVGSCRQLLPAPAATAARRYTIRWKKAHRRGGPGSVAPARPARPGTRGRVSHGAKRNSGTTGISPSP